MTFSKKFLTTEDASPEALKNKSIAVIGYGSQGRAQAQCLRDSGLDITVGVRENGPSFKLACADGFTPISIADAAAKAELIHILIPDECQAEVYAEDIEPHLTTGKTVSFSHGFSITYKRIMPPDDVDVILIAPKGPGTEVRKTFVAGFGVAGLIAVARDFSGCAKEEALAMAHALGLTRAGVLECTFNQETYEDLFGEQAVICGGAVELIKAGFETLIEAGYPPEMAYFECLHELKLTVDLICEGGISHMWDIVSNTAEYGGRTFGPEIIGSEVRKGMKKVLDAIRSGDFAESWAEEYAAGMPRLKSLRAQDETDPLEIVGKKIRNILSQRSS